MRMEEYVKNLILIPGILILYYYAVTGKVLNIGLTYVVLDMFVLIGIIRYEQKRRIRRRMEEEEENSGRALANTLRKLDDLRSINWK